MISGIFVGMRAGKDYDQFSIGRQGNGTLNCCTGSDSGVDNFVGSLINNPMIEGLESDPDSISFCHILINLQFLI